VIILGVQTYTIYHSFKQEEILLFQDIWMQKILITVLYCNNSNNFYVTWYSDVIISYWHHMFYDLHMTKLYSNAIYIYIAVSRIIVNLLDHLSAQNAHVYYICHSDMLWHSKHHLQGAHNAKFKTSCQKTVPQLVGSVGYIIV
jgi:hypothetical protein